MMDYWFGSYELPTASEDEDMVPHIWHLNHDEH